MGEPMKEAVVEVEAGEEMEPAFAEPPPEVPPPRPAPRATAMPEPPREILTAHPFNWGWVTLGGAAASAVAGGVLYKLAYDRFEEADGLSHLAPNYDRRFENLVDEGDGLRVGAIGALGGAAVLGLITWLIWDEDGSEVAAPLYLLPSASPEAVGLQLRWTR